MSDPIVNRVVELKRPSEKYPRTFVPVDINLSDWNQIEPLFHQLLATELNSVKAVEDWLLKNAEIGAVIEEEGSRRYVAMTCATDDEAAEKAYLQFVEEIMPRLKPLSNQLDKKLIESPFTAQLDQKRYGVMLRSTRNQLELFREENIPLETELDKLSQQYQKLQGAMTVQFRGEERTMQQMGVFQIERDRATRQEAWEAATRKRLAITEQLEDIFDQMLKLRHQIALNAGFSDFRAYQFRRFDRFDYTPAECEAFHKAVEEFVVPVNLKNLEERRKALGINSVRPWDGACDRYGRDPLKPFETVEQLVYGCREIFSKVDERLVNHFDVLIKNGLLDLASRKGKAPGGYQTSLSEIRLPFIFMNAVGLNGDVFTLLHEGGHAFHSLSTVHEPLLGYRSSPMEFAEVASMTMEHIGAPHLEAFYPTPKAARARYDHFQGAIGLLAWIATVDAFQHWIYTHPGHARKERGDYWISLMNRFMPGVDFTDWEEALRYRWHAQLHIFEYPFYYIEYGIAQLGALQIWRNSKSGVKKAVDAYLAGLSLGASVTLPELFKTAGAKFDFSASTICPLMEDVQAELDQQAALEEK